MEHLLSCDLSVCTNDRGTSLTASETQGKGSYSGSKPRTCLEHESTGSYLVVIGYDFDVEAISDEEWELLGDIVLFVDPLIDL